MTENDRSVNNMIGSILMSQSPEDLSCPSFAMAFASSPYTTSKGQWEQVSAGDIIESRTLVGIDLSYSPFLISLSAQAIIRMMNNILHTWQRE